MDYDDDDPRKHKPNLNDLEEKFRRSVTIAIQTKGAKQTRDSRGTGSFQDALSATPDLTTLGLSSHVTGLGRGDVKPVEGPERFKVMFSADGRILTHDGAHLIDSSGTKCRYVILLEADGAYLYTDQCISSSIKLAPEDAFNRYPTLDSHGELVGNVIGAGDMIVDQGQVLYLDNQSGSFQPRGAHLAATLKLFVRTGLIGENQIVSGSVSVAQFIAAGGLNVDEGDLVNLLGAAMDGQLRGTIAAPTRTTPVRPTHEKESASEESDSEKDNQGGSRKDGGDSEIFDFEEDD